LELLTLNLLTVGLGYRKLGLMALILIIDDDPDTREVMKSTLEGAGHEVILASDGRAGVKLYRDRRTDLVITDLFMPNQEGLETIKQMRIEFPDSRIIAMSGRPTSGTMLAVAQRLGANAALQKPFLPEELLKLVEQTL
jgi:two-component system, chemotaxis family, chemotaxis protein CheY